MLKLSSVFVASLAAVVLSGTAYAQVAPTVSLTASPTSGSGAVDVTLTWSSANAISCNASGAWSGSKALSGTQVIAGLTTNASYTLTCAASGGSASLTWVAPTTRTDGSALTNLAQYGIWVGTSATSLVRRNNIPSSTVHPYVVSGLAAGPTWFAMSAIDSANIESVVSNSVNRTITVASASATATVTVQSLPNPPVLAVTAVVANINMSPVYSFSSTGKRGTAVLGHVPVDTGCSGSLVFTYRERGYYRVARSDVKWDHSTPRDNVAAPCELRPALTVG